MFNTYLYLNRYLFRTKYSPLYRLGISRDFMYFTYLKIVRVRSCLVLFPLGKPREFPDDIFTKK